MSTVNGRSLMVSVRDEGGEWVEVAPTANDRGPALFITWDTEEEVEENHRQFMEYVALWDATRHAALINPSLAPNGGPRGFRKGGKKSRRTRW